MVNEGLVPPTLEVIFESLLDVIDTCYNDFRVILNFFIVLNALDVLATLLLRERQCKFLKVPLSLLFIAEILPGDIATLVHITSLLSFEFFVKVIFDQLCSVFPEFSFEFRHNRRTLDDLFDESSYFIS